jgi:4-diphosphocytidyl-2-C-methyl-D-erythritol kinase
MIVLRELAKAKINFYLHVTGKRPDNYHVLDSLVAFSDVGDKLEIIPADEITVTVTGPFAEVVPAKDNSVIKAAQALKTQFKVTHGAAITLHKNLPAGAGLGGGSADAAAALRLLSRFWKLKPTAPELHKISIGLGADVPACLRSTTLYVGGIGETLESGPVMAGLPIVLVYPGKPLLTRDVFMAHKAAFSSAPRHPHAFAERNALIQFLQKNKNDLQSTAITLLPEIGKALDALKTEQGCQLARMTGSGSTCFGCFSDISEAQAAAQKIAEKNPSWWVKPAVIQ